MESIKEYIPYNIKESTVKVIQSGSEKAKDLYGKSKEQTIKLVNYLKPIIISYFGYGKPLTSKMTGINSLTIDSNLPTLIESIRYLMQNPTAQQIKQIVQKYTMIIAVIPVIRDILIYALLKLIGFTAAGIKGHSFVSLIQSSFYGGFIAKGSIFAKLQSIGALATYDPTLITLLLLGGVTFYYFYVYSHSGGKNDLFKWNFKDSLQNSQISLPKQVTYTKDGKFDIKWTHLDNPHTKTWKSLYCI